MDLLIYGFLIALIIYAIVSLLVWKFHIFGNTVKMYGPFMGIQTENVKFFDKFKDLPFLRAYANISTILIFIFGLCMAALLLVALKLTFDISPEPTGVYAPRNVMLIPGLNEFIPVTIGVFLAFVVAGAIHEFGHAIVCRAEGIKIESTGILLAVIPIGAFVNPREEELESASIGSRLRMYSAGIANNFVVGVIAFFLICILISSFVVPTTPGSVYVYKTYGDTGVSPGMYITDINGQRITSSEQVNAILTANANTPLTMTAGYTGDSLSSYIYHNGKGSGFDLVDRGQIQKNVGSMMNVEGMLRFLILPFDTSPEGQGLKQVMMNTVDAEIYTVPFTGFWELIHILYWILFIDISIAIFNAIPMIPLDGGYIFKDIMTRVFGGTRLKNHITKLAYSVSILMFAVIVASIALPYILHFH
jgi:membrane-associated protease RseP (regulator of RpoE activity)